MKTGRHNIIAALAAISIFLAFRSVAWSQATTGIRGLVLDPSDAVIAGAEIEATNLGTAQNFRTSSTSAGTYFLGSLPVGNFRVTAQHPGFKRSVYASVNVSTGTVTTLNVRLELGEVSRDVTVQETAAPLLQPDTAEVATVIDNHTVSDLPLQLAGQRRAAQTFMLLTPGVVPNDPLYNSTFNGTPAFSSQILVDGAVLQDSYSPGSIKGFQPPFEAVDEFKVSNTLPTADIGRGFGTVNFTFKSGGNGFHGNLFEFVRNDKFDARGFFNPSKPVVRQNDYGASVGGPIIKNHTFFFATWNGFKKHGGAGSASILTMPSEAFRRGDLSQLINPNTGAVIPIFDPETTRPDGQGGFVRDPFPGNIIPPSRISTIAKRVIDLLPPPQFPGTINNYVGLEISPTDENVYSWKIDHSFNQRHKIGYTHWLQRLTSFTILPIGNIKYESTIPRGSQADAMRISYDWTISPTKLNHFTLGYSALNTAVGSSNPGNRVIKIPGIPEDATGWPGFFIGNWVPCCLGNTQWFADPNRARTYQFADSLSIARGKHQLKVGGDLWKQVRGQFNGNETAGHFQFSNLETSQPNSPNIGALGSEWASFLLGQVDFALYVRGVTLRRLNLDYLALFVDDKVQLSPKFTLNVGLRYELPWPYRDSEPLRMAAIDPRLPNPAAGGRPGAYVFGNDRVVSRLDKTEFGPRIGLSYALNQKTLLRTGYGIIYAQTNGHGVGSWQFGNAFEAGTAALLTYQSLDNGITPAFLMDQGVPPFTGRLPNRDPGINVDQTADYMHPKASKQAYTHSFQFSIQRELPYRLFLDIAYVGHRGRRFPSALENINQLDPRFLSLGPLLNQRFDSPAAQAAGIVAPYPGFRGTVSQALRPFPQYTRISEPVQPLSFSSYNSMQMKIQRRFSEGFSLLASYTLSKALTDFDNITGFSSLSSVRDTHNRKLERGLAPQDRTHVLTTSWIYELPVGKDLQGIMGKTLKGWQAGLVTRYESGPPLNIRGGPPLPLFGARNRPNRVLGVSGRTNVSPGEFDPAKDRYLNIGAFSQPAPFTFGTVGRIEANLKGFSLWNEDLSIIKRINVTESSTFEFRAEFFNLFNRVVFGEIRNDINDPTRFGQVFNTKNQPRVIQFGLKFIF